MNKDHPRDIYNALYYALRSAEQMAEYLQQQSAWSDPELIGEIVLRIRDLTAMTEVAKRNGLQNYLNGENT